MTPDFLKQQLDAMEAALIAGGLNATELQLCLVIAEQFLQVAVGLLQQEPGFQQAPEQPLIPFSPQQCQQTLLFFAKGLQQASLRLWQEGIDGEPKSLLLQTLAQDLFFQAKQVVAATVGQENTPDLVFSEEQQLGWLFQGLESGLAHHVTELEKQQGPIARRQAGGGAPARTPHSYANTGATGEAPATPNPALTTAAEEPSAYASYSSEEHPHHDTLMTQQAVEASWGTTVSPHSVQGTQEEKQLNKLAALGLFLSTQPPAAQQEWLHRFEEPQQRTITHYMHPQHVQLERDMEAVLEELQALQATIEAQVQQPAFAEGTLHGQLAQLLQRHPPTLWEELIRYEHPYLKRYLRALLQAGGHQPPLGLPMPMVHTLLRYFGRIAEGALSHAG
jgi:hypothetical protein